MTQPHAYFSKLQKLLYAFVLSALFLQCSEEQILPASRERITPGYDSIPTTDDNLTGDCRECAYVVPADSTVIDGKVLGLKPGDVIGLQSGVKYGTLEFHNIVGSADKPIVIKNFGGPATIVATDKWHAVKTENSKYFRITGGTTAGEYGIHIQGGEMGLKMDGFSTNFEVDHVEVSKAGFAGIMAKTDPTCDDATLRGNFTMYDVSFHDNYVHDTGGEGFYIGNSFYDGMERECGVRLPHEIKGLKVFNNKVKNTGWEAIQVGCASEGAEIHDNTIENYGTANKQYQNNGIQIGAGTGGLLYNNFVKSGPGNGLIIMGIGDNVIYNNIVVDPGLNGIFCDERNTPGEGFKFINNTIVNPGMYGIRLYSELVPLNMVINNIIVKPGTDSADEGGRTSTDAFVNLMSSEVKVTMSNNLFVGSLDEVEFINPSQDNYRLKPNSPAINFGKDISDFSITFDFYRGKRLNGVAYDIGASEF